MRLVVMREPDAHQCGPERGGEHDPRPDKQRRAVAGAKQRRDDQRAEDLTDPVPGRQDGHRTADAEVAASSKRQGRDAHERAAEQRGRDQRWCRPDETAATRYRSPAAAAHR